MFSIHKIPKISCEPQYSIARLPSNMFNVLSAVDLTEANYYFTTADIDNVTDTDAVYYVVGEDTVQQTPEPCTAPVDVSNKEAVWCSWVEWSESCRNTRAWSYIPTCTIKDPSVMTNGPVKPIDTNDIFTPVPVPTAQVPLVQIQATIKRSRGITEVIGSSPIYVRRSGRRVTIGMNDKDKEALNKPTPKHTSSDGFLTITGDGSSAFRELSSPEYVVRNTKTGKTVSTGSALTGKPFTEEDKPTERFKKDGSTSSSSSDTPKLRDSEKSSIIKSVLKDAEANNNPINKDDLSVDVRTHDWDVGNIDFTSNLVVKLDSKLGAGLVLNGRDYQGNSVEGAEASDTPHTYSFGFIGGVSVPLYAGENGIIVRNKDTEEPIKADDATYIISMEKSDDISLYGDSPIKVEKRAKDDEDSWETITKGNIKISIDSENLTPKLYGKAPIVVRDGNGTEVKGAEGYYSISAEGVLTGIKNNEGVADFIKLVEEGGVVSLRYGKDFNKLLDPQQIGIEQGEGIIVKQPNKSDTGKYVISLDKSKLPSISLVGGASDYLMVDGHTIGLKPKALTALNSAVNMPKPDNKYITIQNNQLTVVEDNIKKLAPIQSITTPISLDNPITVKQAGTQVTISLNKDMLPKAPIQDVKGDNTFIKTNKDDNGVVTVSFDSDKVVHTLHVKPSDNDIIKTSGSTGDITLTVNTDAISALSPIKKIEGGDNISATGPDTNGVVTLDLTAAGQGVRGLLAGDNIKLTGGIAGPSGSRAGIVTINGQPGGVTKIIAGDYLDVDPPNGTGAVTINLSADLEKAIGLLSSLANLTGTGILEKTSTGFKLHSTTNSCS